MKPCIAVFIASAFICASTVRISSAETALEPWRYHQDFESREVSAWASYPLWQDTAYDDNFYAGEIVHGDPNVSIVQLVTPKSHNDAYAGAQKKLGMYLTPASSVTARMYIKSHLPAEYVKVRLASGDDGAVDYTIADPPLNCWFGIDAGFDGFVADNPRLAGKDRIVADGIAFLVKIPKADPDMPIHLGIDDVAIDGAREMHFVFIEPSMHKLPEWTPYIPKHHYRTGDSFALSGQWNCGAKTVTLTVTPFADRSKTILNASLTESNGIWSLKPFKVAFEPGLYLAKLTALDSHDGIRAGTEFTVYVAPPGNGGSHPRLWYGERGRQRIAEQLASTEYSDLVNELNAQAEKYRKQYPLDILVYDFDQFPVKDWLVTRYSWSLDRIRSVGEAAFHNALAYSLLGDETAGMYAKNVLVTYASFPTWNHPWMINRGRHFYLLIGDMAMYFAHAYDLTYGIMSEDEREIVQEAFLRNVIEGAHRSYVHANLVTNNTSNWIAAIMGGSIACQAAIYGESPETAVMEPYFTGSILKMNALIQNVIGGDGGYGEGYSYYHYSSRSWSKSLPSLERVFRVDISGKLNGVYSEFAWAGLIKDTYCFYYGDSRGELQPMEAWAWLLPKYRDPLLAWLYYHTNPGETKTVTGFETFSKSGVPLFSIMQGTTIQDLIYDTKNTPAKPPYDENPVRLFRDIGTTVFKSGWESDDFVFVMRTGPFYNHQHLDQGSFWLADRGEKFIVEHTGSSYYDDPLYESHYTQPIAHSTVIIDGNPQSQRTGDPVGFMAGFEDHAFIRCFLDGERAAYTSGDIGRLYMGKVDGMQRCALYIKPRTVILVDTVFPSGDDVDITELFQTRYLDEIDAANDISTISKERASLVVAHLAPAERTVHAEEMPHFLSDYREIPLRRRGCVSVTARTEGIPLVMANMLTTTAPGESPVITSESGDGFVRGTSNDVSFALSTRPGAVWRAEGFETDALAMTWSGDTIFAAECTVLARDGNPILLTTESMIFEIGAGILHYSLAKDAETTITVPARPKMLTVDGESKTLVYDYARKAVILTLPAGDHTVVIE